MKITLFPVYFFYNNFSLSPCPFTRFLNATPFLWWQLAKGMQEWIALLWHLNYINTEMQNRVLFYFISKLNAFTERHCYLHYNLRATLVNLECSELVYSIFEMDGWAQHKKCIKLKIWLHLEWTCILKNIWDSETKPKFLGSLHLDECYPLFKVNIFRFYF